MGVMGGAPDWCFFPVAFGVLLFVVASGFELELDLLMDIMLRL